MRVAVIGCGVIGKKRAQALGPHRLVIAADLDLERARELVALVPGHAEVTADWRQAAGHPDAEAVLVCAPNDLLTPAGRFALAHGKHVLVEKPAGRTAREISEWLTLARAVNLKVKVGFNLRFHPALAQAKEIVAGNGIGPLMFLRGRYGHGGRVGYEREWRAQPDVSGGGELIDQGVHLLDLARWFLGDLEVAYGFPNTYFWKMPVDDNCFMALQTPARQMAWLHVSCTEWKNQFCLEIFGRTGKLQIDGLGGSYGAEKLIQYRMRPEMGPPETQVWEYPGEDVSWKKELETFFAAIAMNAPLEGGLEDAYAALLLVDRIYGRA
jgi:predicted dehydrogenase